MKLESWLSVNHRLLFVFNNTTTVLYYVSCRSLSWYINNILTARFKVICKKCDTTKVNVQKSELNVILGDTGLDVLRLSCSRAMRKDVQRFKGTDVKKTFIKRTNLIPVRFWLLCYCKCNDWKNK